MNPEALFFSGLITALVAIYIRISILQNRISDLTDIIISGNKQLDLQNQVLSNIIENSK